MATVLGRSQSRYWPRRTIYIALSLLAFLIAFTGFWPSYFGPLVAGSVDSESIIHFHAVVYLGWLSLFLAQVVFAATGRMALHRKLGSWGIGYGLLIIVVGLATTFMRFSRQIAEVGIEEAQGYLVWPVTDMVIFAAFFGPAIYYRRKPEIHKRLMIVATTNLLVAAAVRLQFDGSALPLPVFIMIWLSPILLAIGYDLWTRRLMHPVYVAGFGVLALSSYRDVLMGSDIWLGFTYWVASLAS